MCFVCRHYHCCRDIVVVVASVISACQGLAVVTVV